MKNLIFALILICLSFPFDLVSAQDSQCDLESFFASLSELKPTGDQEKDLSLISDLEASLRALRTACAEYKWSGKGTVVTELFELPAGVFKAEFKSTDSLVGDLTIIDGYCDMSYFSQLSPIDPDTPLSRLIKSDGCTAVFEITVADAPWTITIIPLK